MFTSEFVHRVESVSMSRNHQPENDAHVITLVIKTESGEKTMHLFSSEPVEIQDEGIARLKAKWQAEALEGMASRLWPVGMIGKGVEREALLLRADELRRQTKEPQ